MPLGDLSFGLFEDSGLTTPFSGTLQTLHETSLSDNPQDFLLYFGSANPLVQLEATSNPGTDQITLTPTDILPGWVAATSYSLGDVVEPTTPNTRKYRCTTSGTSHASVEPTWPTGAIGDTVSDGTVIWTLVGLKHPTTEFKLATTSGGLGAATPGAALNIGTTIEGDDANAVEVHIRVTNTVTTVNNNTGHAELALVINEVIETDIP